ncbi:MAG: polysaccharide biosynthesis protein [Oscillospiraceae bacterium]|jgi:stage V sporulation protein B|nr:polysaccharide biosynthesis protein [Oscillospiraceae bacterium]
MAGKSQNFLRGALSLSAATAAVKVIGALYKIPIQRVLGADGSSLYYVAYNIYTFIFVLATAGLPVAISKMVSESRTAGRSDAERIFSVAFSLFLVIGTAGALFILLGADWIAARMHAEEAVWAIRAIAPSIFLVVFISPYRGYYQGHGNMTPTAVSQVLEALGKLIFGVSLTAFVLYVIIPADGTEANHTARNTFGPAAAILGVSAGVLLAALYLIFRSRGQRLRKVRGSGRPRGEILREMVGVAIPITLGSAVLNVTNLIDSGLTRGLLVSGAGYTESRRDFYHGAYTWAATLYNLPSAFVLTIAVSLLPAIAACRVRRDRQGVITTTRSAIRVTALLGMPAGVGFFCLAGPILNLLYGGGEKEAEAIRIAAPLLRTLGIAVIFVCIVTVSNSILQSLGLVTIPIVTMAAGSAAKLICTYALVGNPAVHINGVPIGTVVCFGLIAVLNLGIVIKATGAGVALLGEMVKPFLAAAGMGVIALGCYHFFAYFLGERIGVVLAIGAGGLSYALLLILIKGVPKRDLELLPGGARLAQKLQIR